MKDISPILKTILYQVFFSEEENLSLGIPQDYPVLDNSYTSQLVRYDNHNLFLKGLKMQMTEGILELPIICENRLLIKLLDKDNSLQVGDEVIFNLFRGGQPCNKRVANTMIGHFFRTTIHGRLSKCVTSGGEPYYGGRGLILNSDLTPLLLVTSVYEHIHKEDDKDSYENLKYKCYVHPQVFREPSKILHKSILYHVIPYYESLKVNIPFSDGKCSNIEVIVKDIEDKFFINTPRPSIKADLNGDLNQFLRDNIPSITGDNFIR
nr:MAG TPA: hypothetical protein [Crassvirales sp.]